MVSRAQQTLDKFWDGHLPVDPEAIAKAIGFAVVEAEQTPAARWGADTLYLQQRIQELHP